MNIAFFSAHEFEKKIFLNVFSQSHFQLTFFDACLNDQTVKLASSYPLICAFVSDKLDKNVLETLKNNGTGGVLLRSAGFNHVDMTTANRLQIKVYRVPEYSPHAIAEHALALILSLNRKIHRSYLRVRDGNFSLNGLVGFDLYQKKVGIIGTGKIGSVMAKIMLGLGCQLLAFDKTPDSKLISLGVQYIALDELLSNSDIISLHIPLTPETFHLIDERALRLTRPGVMIINTGRGKLIETASLIKFLKNGHIGSAGLDVYEEEEGVFFENFSDQILQDDVLARLLTFPNVLVTSHQGFLTKEALSNIANTTLKNAECFEKNLSTPHLIS